MRKENTVALIYHCSHSCEQVINNRPKLQRRLQRAIEDMAEDGFFNFILPLDKRSPFTACFIDAIVAERSHNPNIRLTIMLPFQIEEYLSESPADHLRAYTQHADQIIYNQRERVSDQPTHQIENLLNLSSGVIIHFDNYCQQQTHIIHQTLIERKPLITINI